MEIERLIHLNKEKVRIMYMSYSTVVSVCKNLYDLHYFLRLILHTRDFLELSMVREIRISSVLYFLSVSQQLIFDLKSRRAEYGSITTAFNLTSV